MAADPLALNQKYVIQTIVVVHLSIARYCCDDGHRYPKEEMELISTIIVLFSR